MQPTIPQYTYTEQTTLASCFRAFFSANPALNPKMVFESIGVADPQVWKRWMNGQWNQPLLSVYKLAVLRVMGIDLDRLVIIHLKHQILDDLDHLDIIKRKNPRLSHLLRRNPRLKELVSFSTYQTRLEIVQKILEHRTLIGSGLLARQLGIPSRTSLVTCWDLDKRLPGWAPGETGHLRDLLKRCLILLFAGVRSGKREDVRVALITEEVLGCLPNEIRLTTFEDVLDGLKKLDPALSVPVLSIRIGLSCPTIKRLVSGQTQNAAKIPDETILVLIKALLKNHFPTKQDSIEKAVLEFSSETGVIHPVFHSEEELFQTLFPQSQAEKINTVVPSVIFSEVLVVSPQNYDHDRISILLHYLSEQMQVLLETVPKKEDESEFAEMMGILSLTQAFLETGKEKKKKSERLTTEQKTALLQGFGLMLKLGKFLVRLHPEDRQELVPSVDKILLSLAHQLTAASLEDPLEFLQQMSFETATQPSSRRKPS
ncbi:MAG: hypothetical protein UU08_C0035G0004 [Candidatus Uhrbacteria bacterium GW2011_GWE2_40_58]|nr:MAG: hypothetical protein UT94_C0017G0001 [Candidatus Uhrbacteria bacterium GW2011_GWF2_40_263]KKR66692.1 MAG: hypothetical protein UU08_C0035G0004 [Candidatus Uhrbacteria bacterium GW2011_GWE2_40_58]OGL96692.1 MAG: hypothetical protein A2332_03390 [Candidatus Uhrbacteria bacterium RIFOXYB2_FULL_41_18]HCB56354.1 hypothetical protein [Candidatus Uhrbacteria bacterium]